MKRVILFSFLFVFTSGFLQAQSEKEEESPDYSPGIHEFNVGVLNLFGELPEISQSSRGSGTQSGLEEYEAPGFSIGYKYHTGSSAFRTGLGMSFYHGENDSTITEDSSAFAMYAGYQYEILRNRSCLYLGGDLFFENQNATRIKEKIPFPDFYEKTNQIHFAYGLRPFVGIRFFVSEHISLSTETYYYLRWFDMTEKVFDEDGDKTSEENITGSNMKFGPIGTVSVNFHLK